MTEVYEEFALPARINIFKCQNKETGGLVGVCTDIEKNVNPPRNTHCGLQHSATTCCPCYPSGSTVLECRLEGDQPVAHVVQVPADRNTATQKMCLLVETKQSPSGPLSRVISRPQEVPRGFAEHPNQSREISPMMTYCLESHECPGGASAMAGKLPTTSSNLVTTLETIKGDKACNGPSSRIVYGPAMENITEASSCESNSRDPGMTFIDCTASCKGTSARIAHQCCNEIVNCRKNCFETGVPLDGGCPTAVGFQGPSANTSSCQQDLLETRVDECGPRTCLISHPRDCGNYCSYMESKSSCDGPSAKVTQVPGKLVCEENCLATCSVAKDNQKRPPAICRDTVPSSERRNGLDPSQNTRPTRFKPCPRKQACCSPSPLLEKSKPKPTSVARNQLDHGDSIRCEPIKTIVVPETKKLMEDQCKTKEEIVDSSSNVSKTASQKTVKAAVKGSIECVENYDAKITSEELLTCYRDYVPPSLLDRYESCRSKRNGLQDQCFLPVPRAVVELKKTETYCRSDDQDKSNKGDANGESDCAMNGLVTPPVSLASVASKNPNDSTEAKDQKSCSTF